MPDRLRNTGGTAPLLKTSVTTPADELQSTTPITTTAEVSTDSLHPEPRHGLFGRIGEKLGSFLSAMDSVNDIIRAELQSSGIFGQKLEAWADRSQRLAGLVAKSELPPGSGVTGSKFLSELEQLTGAKLSAGNSVKVLADGPQAFERRLEAIANAKSDIKLMTWAFYDDSAGLQTAKALIAKARQGISVSVTVDFDVAQKKGHHGALDLLEQAAKAEGLPISVRRWENPDVKGQGQHQKYLVIDHGATVIAGGRNPGDVYYGLGTKAAAWRDLEVEVSGPAALEMNAAYVNEWNAQVKAHQNGTPLEVKPAGPGLTGGGVRSAVIEHTPGGAESNLTVATLKGIRGASKSFTMANAYLLSIPAVREELKAAVKRGVDVRVLTNSAQSIDETAISAPILETAKELSAGGVKMYLTKNSQPDREGTTTLHAKYWISDGELSMVQSHNEHPRSDYYEKEVGLASVDAELGKQLEKEFAASIAPDQATAITKPDDLVMPKGLMTDLKARLVTGLFRRQS